MRGKKPKDRKSYVLRMGDGTLVEVTREIYLEWYQSKRREKYQQEKSLKYGICSLDELSEKGDFSKVRIDLDVSPEECAIKNIYFETLKRALDNIPESDAYLVYLLYFKEVTVKEAAQICGCSRRTIQNRRKRILNELKNSMEELDIQGGYF